MAFWSSYNSTRRPLRYGDFGHCGCMISAVLDAGAHEFCGGIRLVVVSRDDVGTDNFILRNCLKPTKKDFVHGEGPHPTYRQLLSRRKRDVERGRQVLSIHTLPLCTVVLEVVHITTAAGTAVRLVPPREPLSSSPRRIVYEQSYPCSPTQHSFVTYLDSSHSFGENDLLLPDDIPFLGSSTLIEYNIRIMPIYARSPFIALPPRVLRWILQSAFKVWNIGWRRELPDISMVCKGWSHALDLFFYGLPRVENTDPPNAIAVAHSLEMRPDRASMVRELGPYNFAWNTRGSKIHDEAFVAILRQTTSLKRAEIQDTHESQILATVDALSQLCKLETFKSTFHPRKQKTGICTMLDLQRAVENSTNLRKFYAQGWNPPSDTELRDPPNAEIPSPTKLEVLDISYGYISGPRFLHFAAPSLRKLHMMGITGVMNSDLLAFLVQVSSTLETLAIGSTVILRTSCDEYALDAAMPLMANLTHVWIDGDLASVLALMRKPASPPGIGASVFYFQDVQTSVFGMESILKAAAVTNWDDITLFPSYSEPEWERGIRSQANERSRKRGVKFSFSALMEI